MEEAAAWLRSLAEAPGASLREEEDGSLAVRLVPAEGLYSFVSIERDPSAFFGPTVRLELSTLVATEVDLSSDVQRFLDDANSTAFTGAWEWFRDGDVGLTGSLLLQPEAQPPPRALLAQLLALQVEDARAIGRPEGSVGFEDALPTAAPAAEPAWSRTVSLQELVDRVEWRSSHEWSSRWVTELVEDDRVDFLVPSFVGDPIRNAHGELLERLSTLSLARTVHPRCGAGTLIQVHLPESIRKDALRFRSAPIATQAARWYGTCVGALTIAGEQQPEVVYRAFLSDELLSVASPKQALSVLVEAVMGSVNAAGVATRLFEALAAEEDIEEAQRAIRQKQRTAVLRAVTQSQPTSQGSASFDSPVVDVGGAMLDWLALDQLQITTAPFVTFDRGFAWRPTAHTQHVTADPMVPSRLHEISYLRIATYLGEVQEVDADRLQQRADGLQHTLPLGSLVVEDGQVRLRSTLVIHEGVWWHRSALAAVVAAMHANLAPHLADRLATTGLDPQPHPAFAEAEPRDPDTIVDVVPFLIEQRDRARDEVLASLRRRLLESPGARRMDADGPDAIIPLRANDDFGGWDPPLGEVAVFLTLVEDPVVGPATQITVNAGFPAGSDVDVATKLHELTRRAHDQPVSGFVPAWVALPETLGTVLTIPDIAITHAPRDSRAAILNQAVNGCVFEMARAVIEGPELLPGFDHALVNLGRTPHRVPESLSTIDGSAIWPPGPNLRILAFRTKEHPDHWSSGMLDHWRAEALANWLHDIGYEPAPAFGDLTVARREGALHIGFSSGETYELGAEEEDALQDSLRYPEGAAVRRQGNIVVTPTDVGATQDGVYLVLPPAPGLVEVLTGEVRFDGVTATTDRSLWIRWTSPHGRVHIDLNFGFVDAILADFAEWTEVSIECPFPTVDVRLTSRTPPEGVTGSLSILQLRRAAERVRERDC